MARLQRTQSPSGDCNSSISCPFSSRRVRIVATHSIPFRGLQRGMSAPQQAPGFRGELQRTQSPSGDCNSVYILIRSAPGPTAVATHSIPFRGLQPAPNDRSDPICVLLVATHSIPFRGLQLLARLGFEAGLYRDIVATHSIPFRGLQQLPCLDRPARVSPVRVATHSIPFRGLQLAGATLTPSMLLRKRVATHSIPFRGLQPAQVHLPLKLLGLRRSCNALNPLQGIATASTAMVSIPSSILLQRTQSPSGDCNDIRPYLSGGHGCDSCNALDPLQGIATSPGKQSISRPGTGSLQRSRSSSGDCNTQATLQQFLRLRCPVSRNDSNPLQGIATFFVLPQENDPRAPRSQRLQSSSGDCNAGGVLRRSQEPRGHRSQRSASFSAMTPCYPSLSVPLV